MVLFIAVSGSVVQNYSLGGCKFQKKFRNNIFFSRGLNSEKTSLSFDDNIRDTHLAAEGRQNDELYFY